MTAVTGIFTHRFKEGFPEQALVKFKSKRVTANNQVNTGEMNISGKEHGRYRCSEGRKRREKRELGRERDEQLGTSPLQCLGAHGRTRKVNQEGTCKSLEREKEEEGKITETKRKKCLKM